MLNENASHTQGVSTFDRNKRECGILPTCVCLVFCLQNIKLEIFNLMNKQINFPKWHIFWMQN